MTGGELKIEVLPAGAGRAGVLLGLADAVSKGTLNGGHGGAVYHYASRTRWRCGASAAFGMGCYMLLSWHKYGGGEGNRDRSRTA